jgi:hypothetical protein
MNQNDTELILFLDSFYFNTKLIDLGDRLNNSFNKFLRRNKKFVGKLSNITFY